MHLPLHYENKYKVNLFMGFPGSSDSKESASKTGDLGLISGLGRSPGERHGNPLQYSCLETPHEQRNVVSSWGPKESDLTERLSTYTHTRIYKNSTNT